MFDSIDGLVARLAATAPPVPEDPDDVWPPLVDPDGSIVTEIVDLERAKAMIEARLIVLTAGLADRATAWVDPRTVDPDGGPSRETLVAAELAPALHLSPVTAAIRVDRAIRVRDRLPATLRVMSRGDLDLGRVLAIDDATSGLEDDLTTEVEHLVLARAVDQTAGELRAALKRAVMRIDPQRAERRRRQAIKDRSVWRYARRDGTSGIEAVLTALDTGEIYDLIDEVARRTKTTDDTRSMDARRADAFVYLMLGRDPHLGPQDDPPPGEPPPGREPPPDPADDDIRPDDLSAGGEQAATRDECFRTGDDHGLGRSGLVEPADLVERLPPEPADPGPPGLTRSERISELAALAIPAMIQRRPARLPWVAINHTTGPDGSTVLVGELQGYGPISGEYARHLLRSGAARPPDQSSGRVPTLAEARAHDPPDWLDREVRARDGTCRAPGCRQPAHRVDLDHTEPHPRGLTVRENLGGLCRRHHRVKHSGAWTVHQHADGIYVWTSTVTGRRYTTYPRGATGAWRGTTAHS